MAIQRAIGQFDADKIEAKGKAAGLSRLEALAVYLYTSDFGDGRSLFLAINNFLRFGKVTMLTAVTLDEYIHVLVGALKALPRFSGETFRRTSLPPILRERLHRSPEFADRAFLSSSKSPEMLFRGSDFLILESRSGRDVSSLSAVPGEDEVVFLPGTRFLVTSVNRAGRGVVADLVEAQ